MGAVMRIGTFLLSDALMHAFDCNRHDRSNSWRGLNMPEPSLYSIV